MRKILILGHARHGKDTAAGIIADYLGVTYKGSSEICAELLYEVLRLKYGYKDADECFEDRVNHRAEWHEAIKKINETDKAALAKIVYRTNDIYCGVRDTEELNAIIEEFDPLIIWVEDPRKPKEPKNSMNIECRISFWVAGNHEGIPELRKVLLGILQSEQYQGKWTTRFMRLASEVATWSKDPESKVGAVLVSADRHSIATGYNGVPTGVADVSKLTLSNKNDYIAHAEQNAIWNARRSVQGWALYTTKPPCLGCAIAIIQAGIANVYCPQLFSSSSWSKSQNAALELLKEANITVHIVPN